MTTRETLRWIQRHGIRAWLTWATVEQACGAPLTRSQRFWRKVFDWRSPLRRQRSPKSERKMEER